ncbi:protein arginine N-methyltransferase 8 [Platysternon megacephalum]|uniref:Protein arginine N-methyltransferase 8 n=1 Tax=Platysternon megacephalum TaxID=55544 RepID=A0A4D9E5N9_9SAUR|nr:protein arginine N-methyltransferase 8 [Platysternon megacephalum]
MSLGLSFKQPNLMNVPFAIMGDIFCIRYILSPKEHPHLIISATQAHIGESTVKGTRNTFVSTHEFLGTPLFSASQPQPGEGTEHHQTWLTHAACLHVKRGCNWSDNLNLTAAFF